MTILHLVINMRKNIFEPNFKVIAVTTSQWSNFHFIDEREKSVKKLGDVQEDLLYLLNIIDPHLPPCVQWCITI